MLTKREFLAAMTAAVVMPAGRAYGQDRAARQLVAREGRALLLEKGQPHTPIWGYDGTVPGPEIRVPQGRAFAVEVTNRLPEPTTVHWHGLRIDNAMDGVAGMTQPPIAPGATFPYRFTPPDAGTFWYHPHNRTWAQMARGLYGAFVVEESKPPAVDQDRVLIFDDWRLGDDGRIDERSMGSLRDRAHAGRLGNILTLNGAAEQDIQVRAGERIRFRLLNAANARVMGIIFEGHAPIVVALDGQPVEVPFAPDNTLVLLAPAQRADVILDCTEETGTTTRVLVAAGRERISLGRLVYDKSRRARPRPLGGLPVLAPNPIDRKLDLKTAVAVDLVMDGGAMAPLPGAKYKGQHYSMRDLARQHGQVWAFNGIAGMDAKPLFNVRRGTTVAVRMVNRTMWPHAMHFHGHHVQEVAHSARKAEPHWRDTVLMQRAETVTVAFKADNPGKWMLHCHMLEHQAGGMGTWFQVT